MRLPEPPPQYDRRDESLTRRSIEQEDVRNHKKGQDIEVSPARIILKSPNGTRWALTVSNAGALSAVAV
jgi:hypothetical protein